MTTRITIHETDVLNLARPRAGVVGESQREVHLFARQNYPGQLTALCGASFHSTDLEFVSITGMPCVCCIAVRARTYW